ncbi:protein phosphatase 2C domain-containing protein [Ruania suaedae]|uniref:PP2C family protein-serine/threonine phosphatase n=1 Tax=Ruania suaedae TaxID=2897774 RepID=UPI001E5694BA|nr:protein phosphatase 2C domain-containing protein [Ruania suaedae]UFU01742.1 protein phosphatase 2C domain-containing protein [Ruania suaedae]
MNEDAVLAHPPVFVVADGMGGHIHGELASRAVIAAFDRLAGECDPDREVRPEQVLEAVHAAQRTIRDALRDERDADGSPITAGSTVAGAVLTVHESEPFWLVLNVGDSRIYRLSEGELTQVSVDHSVVQELVESGALDRAAARRHPQRNVITRAVDTGQDAEVDFWRLHAGSDRLLICSDGLTDELDEEQIGAVLREVASPRDAADRLLAAAVHGGARDNVSVIVVDGPGADVSATAPRVESTGDDVADTVPRGGRVTGGRDVSTWR